MRTHHEVAFRTAYLITLDADEAEDVVQDAYMKVYLALSRFRHGCAFRPWLLKIVANEARNRLVSARRRSALDLRLGESAYFPDPVPSPEAVVLAGERRETLLSAFRLLPEPDRIVITCRYFLDLSEEETAAVLRCRRGTVKSRLSRALGRLRDKLTPAGLTSAEGAVVHE